MGTPGLALAPSESHHMSNPRWDDQPARDQIRAFHLRRCRHLTRPIAATWRNNNQPCNGTTWRLCRSCLDHWLDNADDDPEMEPAELTFHTAATT